MTGAAADVFDSGFDSGGAATRVVQTILGVEPDDIQRDPRPDRRYRQEVPGLASLLLVPLVAAMAYRTWRHPAQPDAIEHLSMARRR